MSTKTAHWMVHNGVIFTAFSSLWLTLLLIHNNNSLSEDTLTYTNSYSVALSISTYVHTYQ